MRQVKSRALENTQYAGGGVHGAWWTNVKKILLVHGGPWWPLPWEKYCWFITWLRRRRQSGRPRCSCSLLPELNRLRCFWFVESESDFVHLCSCDDDLLLQLLDACHVPHVVKILQTSLGIIQRCPTSMVSISMLNWQSLLDWGTN